MTATNEGWSQTAPRGLRRKGPKLLRRRDLLGAGAALAVVAESGFDPVRAAATSGFDWRQCAGQHLEVAWQRAADVEHLQRNTAEFRELTGIDIAYDGAVMKRAFAIIIVVLLGVGMLALGFGTTAWGKYLMPQGPFVEERHEFHSTEAEREASGIPVSIAQAAA
jgi:hypothetical protein